MWGNWVDYSREIEVTWICVGMAGGSFFHGSGTMGTSIANQGWGSQEVVIGQYAQ